MTGSYYNVVLKLILTFLSGNLSESNSRNTVKSQLNKVQLLLIFELNLVWTVICRDLAKTSKSF